MMTRIYEAFACLEQDGAARTLSGYRHWVQSLATREYADELVLIAVALELKVRIVCVPFTPPEALDLWAISSYPDADSSAQMSCHIYLGNNDVHYMWLSRARA
jgi:hypothetical protein